MTIDISQEDFGTLCVCALRYCHGRRTYMPSLVQQIVMAHFKDLSDRDLKVIADDESFQSANGDRNEWYLDAYKKFENQVIREDTADTPQMDCAWR